MMCRIESLVLKGEFYCESLEDSGNGVVSQLV